MNSAAPGVRRIDLGGMKIAAGIVETRQRCQHSQ
jgi:hypothetical protein